MQRKFFYAVIIIPFKGHIHEKGGNIIHKSVHIIHPENITRLVNTYKTAIYVYF